MEPAKKRKSLGKKAFTMMEVMVSALILSLIISGIYAVLNVGNMSFITDMALLEIQQGTRQSIDAIVRELRASSVIGVRSDAADSSHINFDTPSLADIDISHIDSNSDAVRDRIVRQVSGPPRVLANNISSLCFCWEAASGTCRTDCTNLFTVRVRADKTVRQRALTFTLIEQVRLRN